MPDDDEQLHAHDGAFAGMHSHDGGAAHIRRNVEFADVAAYSTRIMSAAHVDNAVSLACRIAVTQRTVAHVSIPVDVQEQAIEEAEPSSRNVAHHVSFAKTDGQRAPDEESLTRALEILNRGKKIAILAGQGALGARDEL